MEKQAQHLSSHLGELKIRLLIWFGVFLASAVCAFMLRTTLLAGLTAPLRATGIDNLVFINLIEPLIMYVKIALVIGFVVSFPLLLWQIWCFLKPGLYTHERQNVWPYFLLMPICSVLGGAFFFSAVLPLALPFLVGFSSDALVPMPTLKAYVNFVTGCILAFAIAFNIPLLLLMLGQLNMLKAQDLRAYRRYMIVFWVILAALFTPPDPLSQLMLAAPLIAMYELVILIMAFQQRRSKV